MKTIIRILLIVAGILLVNNGVFVAGISNFNIGYILAIGIGAIFILYGVFFGLINRMSAHGVLKWVRYVIYLCFLFMFSVILFLAVYGQYDTITYEEDALIVLGAGIHGEVVSRVLGERLKAAIAYYEQNPDVMIIVSGGQGPEEDITEALAMERYLVERGVPPENIIKEEAATSTYENFAFSKEILDERFGTAYNAAYITNGFHVYRAGSIGRLAGLEMTHYHAGMDDYLIAVTYPREFLAVMKLWVLGV